MQTSKRMRMLGFFGLVVVVSVATNLTTSLVANRKTDGFEGQENQTPASYARLSPAVAGSAIDFTAAAELSVHAVVHVKTKTPIRQMQQQYGFPDDPFFQFFFGQPNQRQQQRQEAPMQEASGSGVIISTDGYIVTNNHVIDKAKEIEVTLNDKRTFKAKLIGADSNTDIALIKIEAEKLPVIQFGNSDSLRVGQWVLAVGNPFNLTSTVTAGIVSAKARNINIINSQMKIESFIQTDAAVNPGNSGGALVNTRGELVGINTAIASQTGSYTGYSFAIPVSIVKKVVGDMRQFGVVQRALLGVRISEINDSIAKAKNLKSLEGVFVKEVTEKSAAQKAGIKNGDIITNVNGMNVKTTTELQEQVGRYRPGDKITVTVLRNNKEEKFTVELHNSQGNTSVVSADSDSDGLGATYKEVSEKARQQLGLNYGIEIKSLSKGKFSEAGIKPGFIILKINGQIIKSEEDVQAAYDAVINNGDNEKVLFITGVYANGKIIPFAINLSEDK